jgi:hypothetical protein
MSIQPAKSPVSASGRSHAAAFPEACLCLWAQRMERRIRDPGVPECVLPRKKHPSYLILRSAKVRKKALLMGLSEQWISPAVWPLPFEVSRLLLEPAPGLVSISVSMLVMGSAWALASVLVWASGLPSALETVLVSAAVLGSVLMLAMEWASAMTIMVPPQP